jgi:hypothetical protein
MARRVMTTKAARFARLRRNVMRGRRRRAARPRRKITGSRMTNTRQIGFPFPKSNRMRMRYVESITAFSNTGAIATVPLGMNCLYDPFLGIGGHQPMGFDQAMVYYVNALVERSRISVTATCIDSSLNVPVKFGLFITSDSSFNYTNWGTIQESGSKVSTLITQSTKPVRCSGKYSGPKALFGQDLGQLAQQANSTSANPIRVAYCHLWVQSVDTSSTSDNILFDVVVDYDVKLTEVVQISPS